MTTTTLDKPKRSLFDIGEDLLALNDLLEEIGGDLSDPKAEAAITEWIGQIAIDQERKLDGYAWLIRKLDAEAVVAKEEAERFRAKQKAREGRIVFLKHRLKMHMELQGTKKIETPRFTFAIQSNGGRQALTVISEELLPEQFFVTVPEHQELDRDKLHRALESGEAVNGAILEPRGNGLRIR